MPDAIDVFADAFVVNIMAFGVTLQFGLTKPAPMVLNPPGAAFPVERVATVRMTTELLKGMVFLLREQVIQYEKNGRLRIELPPEMMAPLATSTERWGSLLGVH